MTRATHIAALRWAGIALLGCFVLVIALCAILDWKADELRGPIARAASAHLHTSVRIDDRLELHLLSFHPHAVINGIVVANPSWVGHGELARIGRLKVQLEPSALLRGALVLPVLEIADADINLMRDASDHANWRLGSPRGEDRTSRPARLPVIRSFSLHRARFNYEDAMRELKLTSTVTADENRTGQGPDWARLRGTGIANGQPFVLAVIGQPLLDVRPNRPYMLTFAVRATDTALNGRLSLARAFDLASLQLDFAATGEDMAELYHLTRLALPNTAPYRMTGRLHRDGTRVDLTDLNGKLGSSDLRGTITVETATKRPMMTADLYSDSLNLADIAPAFGTRVARESGGAPARKNAKVTAPPHAAAAPGDAKAPSASAKGPSNDGARVFPDAKLDPKRIRAMDADVRYRANSVQARKIPFRQVTFRLRLNEGVMKVDPVSFVLAQGRVAGRVQMDARRDTPEVALDARLSDVKLSQFHGEDSPPALEGTLMGRALLHGRGSSAHQVVATADGTVVAVVPRGEIRSAFAELTGINVANGLGLLLAKNEQQENLRCGVAQFQALKGTLVAKSLVFDTENVLITGKGEVDLGSERFDLDMSGRPKKIRLLRVRAPIAVRGTLLHPTIGVKTGNTVGQGAAAVGLGALVGPLAAVLAFIDPGLAKDADCSSLINEAHHEGAPLKTASTASEKSEPPPAKVEAPSAQRR
jgi:AsmA family protein